MMQLKEGNNNQSAYCYEEVINIIESARRFGNLPGVEVSGAMQRQLGYPARNIPFVHVAGTNGKGSVCAFLTSILKEAGLKVGTFTSPHLVDFEERITVNGEQIPKEMVAELGNQILKRDFQVKGTMFDYCLVMALLYFEREHCDIMVLETGLGGRLDSTSSVGVPEVSVITKIGFDHTAILGNRLSEIAGEKAGILKEGTYCVMEAQEPEAEHVLTEVAKRVGCAYKLLQPSDLEEVFTYDMRILGVHQKENAAAAMEAARILLGNRGWSEEKMKPVLKKAVEETTWGGRMELLSKEPFFMVDGAHNGHGVLALRDSLKYLYPGEKFHFIMGVMADKDYKEMVKELLPLAYDFVTVSVDSDRALPEEELADFIESQGVPARAESHWEDFLCQVMDGYHGKEKTIAFGSLYFVGDTKRLFCRYKCKRK